MANFVPNYGIIKELEKAVGHLNVSNLPLNPDKRIGEGASAFVYEHTLRKKPAAVKAFKKQISKKKIMEITKDLLKIKHENVVRLRGYSFRPSALLFEYCAVTVNEMVVHNLSQLVGVFNDNDYFVLKERLHYIYQANEGLKYLHSLNIIHRDFKPSNLLINGDVQNVVVKVTDFDGIALVRDTVCTTLTTTTKRKLGTTISYLAPEIFNPASSNCKLSFYSDIYALSISMYEILANVSSPWENVLEHLNDQVLIATMLNGVRPNINDLNKIYPNESKYINQISLWISKAWNENAAERPCIDEVCVIRYFFYFF